jgi:putative membrane protein
MKKIYYLLLMPTLVAIASCHGNNSGMSSSTDSTNSTTIAKDSNSQRFDTTNLQGDANFAVNAADGGMLEAKLGQLAATNASSGDVKSLGKTMYDDHTKANDELKALAQKDNIMLPAALSDKSQSAYDDLAKKTGKDFDKAFAKQMVDDHKKVIDAFQKEANNGNNADLKAWANGKLPVLQGHLQMSEDVLAKLKD